MSEFMDKRNLSLENQIENMIDKVIREDQGESVLKFSDGENSSDNKLNKMQNKIPNNQLLNQTSLNTDQQCNQPYQRANKKHQTISYQSVPHFFGNNKQMFDQSLYEQPLNNYHMVNGTRPNIPFFNNNYSYVNPMLQPQLQQIIPNQITLVYPIGNNYFHPIEPNNTPKFFSTNMGHDNPLLLQQKPPRENMRKKFCTTALPQGTNMKIEMLLYEMGAILNKTEKIDHYIYNKFQNNFISIVQTHKGSRIFQNYLKNTHNEIIHLIFNELTPSLTILMKNSYGNYFCKKFFNFLNQKDKIDFLLQVSSFYLFLLIQIRDSLYELSIHSIGTYPVQGIIDQVGSKIEKNIIISGIKDKIFELSYDTYGTHVLEKIISCFEEEFIGFIIDFAVNNFLILAYHHNGICLIKTILALKHSKELRETLKKIIIKNTSELIQHSCGNYVIQVIVESWDDRELKDIIQKFNGQYVFLSLQKYSSNVVERSIEKSKETLDVYIQEICNSQRISEVMKSNFGNYVIQKALKISKGSNKSVLVNCIMDNIHKLEDKKLIHKWSTIVLPHLEKDQLSQHQEKFQINNEQ